MTSSRHHSVPGASSRIAESAIERWRLQDAKAQFSEVVRRAQSHGPQHVSVHGRAAVVVVAADEFRRLQGLQTGQSLIDALQASPHREWSIEVPRAVMPVRDVTL